ncbi:MAG: mannose-1-phosphate guanylyltransferase/mannose-6-phosphate isomerase [Xanthomonadales bacterium]|nr:mannose-1-phosphate guanylyltransferase/mannose-6-phosphate isomerase [Gammaproteobacteria bacterium]MBT8054669.1 mannose-1-phosphate guanylyltransferase/mannose-6-phosphate isomerase [Gammaproteobacteria bacterium]NND55759.1 mannose-1-phosphate guanylyltransferase/mannose-6-phosphate isomerase [Xanthomonadales bacterium]NNK50170.1 mannose-1-phosphate guanylyltransferase/mannose-6-phosphate isomerase [Xanthomonadales bacterium]
MNPGNPQQKMVPVILSGGSGTRLWPVSRRAHPKPFMKLVDGESLAEKTFRRALDVAGDSPVLTVTSRDYYFYTRDLYNEIDGEEHGHPFLLEPIGRNTAPAIALAAHYVRESAGPDALMLVLPADHLIRDLTRFEAAVNDARELAGRGYLVTFGIFPTHAETGYGYIRRGQAISGSAGHEVAAFVEKPDEQTALAYVESGEYGWNSGMFCFAAGAYLDALHQHAPAIAQCVAECWGSMESGEQPMEIPLELFSTCPSMSIDYAVMEKATNCAVVGGDFGWSDIGSWKAMSELYESDEAGNRIHGKAVMVESTNCFVRGENRLVAAVGIDNLVIIDTGDAILVADQARVQDVKEVVNQLSDLKHEAAEFHKTVFRPWGSYSILEDAEDCKVKRLVIKPGHVLSLQMHHKRAEHWTVIRGTAKVRLGEKEFMLNPNESTYIPLETLHRLENPGSEDLHLIEVQTGEYFGEDDIVRYEDIYGRIK